MTYLHNKLGNNKISEQVLGSSQDGYTPTWNNTDGYLSAHPKVLHQLYPTTNGSSQILIITKIDPIININVGSGPYTFTGTIIFPSGKPFVAIIDNNATSSVTCYLADKIGTGASIVAPMDGYTFQNGYVSITNIDSSAGIYDPSTNPNGIYYVAISGSTGLDGYIGGFPAQGVLNNNLLYYVYPEDPGNEASAPSSTYVDIWSLIQSTLNGATRYFINQSIADYERNIFFTYGSTDVYGIILPSKFTLEVVPGNYIGSPNDPYLKFGLVASVNSDTHITLSAPYSGLGTNYQKMAYIVNYFTPNSSEVFFTQGSTTVTISPAPPGGNGFTSTVNPGDFIGSNLSFSLGSLYNQVLTVDSDTQVTLTSPYLGTTQNQELTVAYNTVTFTHGSPSVTITGIVGAFDFTVFVIAGSYVKLASDPPTFYTLVDAFTSNTITLHSNYPGTSLTGQMDIYSPGVSLGIISDGYTAYVDPNNGHLDWAVVNYNNIFSGISINQQSTSTVVVSDGVKLYSTNGVPAPTVFNNDVFDVGDPGSGTIYNTSYPTNFVTYERIVGTPSIPFSIQVYPSGFIIFDNQTSQPITLISSDGTITYYLGVNQTVQVFSDATKLYTAGNTILPIIDINSDYTIVDPSGTIYSFNAYGFTNVYLPSAPPDGTTYTFQDPLGILGLNVGTITINTGVGDNIFLDSNASLNSTVVMSGAYSKLSLTYRSLYQYWIVSSSEGSPFGVPVIDFSQSPYTQTLHEPGDFFISTLGGVVGFTAYNQPYPGQIISFKDIFASWGTHNFTIISTQGFENPIRVTGSPNPGPGTYASSIVLSTSANYLKYQYDSQSGSWLLISQLLPEA